MGRTHLFCDGELVGAGVAGPFVVARFVVDDEQVGAGWAE